MSNISQFALKPHDMCFLFQPFHPVNLDHATNRSCFNQSVVEDRIKLQKFVFGSLNIGWQIRESMLLNTSLPVLDGVFDISENGLKVRYFIGQNIDFSVSMIKVLYFFKVFCNGT